MATIVTRYGKGTTLTWAEMDANLNNINTKLGESISVLDYGLTGVGDETALLSTIITAAAGKRIDGQGMTVNISGLFNWTIPVYFYNLNFNLTNTGYCLNPKGTLGTSKSPTGVLTAGQYQITFPSNTGYAAGDLLFITSTDAWGIYGEVKSQWAEVESTAVGGTVVTLKAPLEYAFSTSILVYKPAMIQGLKFENCTFTGVAEDAHNQILLRPEYIRRLSLINCKFNNVSQAFIELFRCYDISFYNVEFNNALKTGYGYGIVFDGGCELINGFGVHGSNVRHMITSGGTQGINRKAQFFGTICNNARNGIVDTHPSSDQFSFYGVGGSMMPGYNDDVVMMEGSRCRVKGITVSNSAGSISWQPSSVLADDWCELDGQHDNFQVGFDKFAFTVVNDKTSGSIREVKITGGCSNITAAGGRGVLIRNQSATVDLNSVKVNGTFKTSGLCVQVDNTAAGIIKNVVFEGYYERNNTTAEVFQFAPTASGKVTNVWVNAHIVGGTWGLRNISNYVTNMYVGCVERITGFATAATTGTMLKPTYA